MTKGNKRRIIIQKKWYIGNTLFINRNKIRFI